MYPVDQVAKSSNFRMRLFVKILDFIFTIHLFVLFLFPFLLEFFLFPITIIIFSQHLVENLVALENSHRLIIAWFTFAKIFVLNDSEQPR